MKYVSTTRSYLSFQAGENTISHRPTKLANDAAEKAEKDAAAAGVRLSVVDEADYDEQAAHQVDAVRPPDLSAGIGAITGKGAPVQTLDTPTADQGADDTDPDA